MEQPREYKQLGNPPGQELGGEYASNWFFSRQRTKAYKFRLLFNTSKNRNIKFTREGMAEKNTEYLHPVIVRFMAKFRQKYSTPYFAKVLVAGKKTTKDLPKYEGNLHGKRDTCMHQILEKCTNPKC